MNSTFLGSFTSAEDAAEELDRVITVPYISGAWYYGLVGSGIRSITSFSPGTVVRADVYFWHGPFLVAEDTAEVIRGYVEHEVGHDYPSVAPTREAQIIINDSGDMWTSNQETITHTDPSTWTDASLSTIPKADATWGCYRGAHDTVHSTTIAVDCHFAFDRQLHLWVYRDGTTTYETANLAGVEQWFRNNPSHLANAPTGLFATEGLFVGFVKHASVSFNTDEAAAEKAGQFTYDDSTLERFTWFLKEGTGPNSWVLRFAPVGAFNQGVTQKSGHLYWQGPVLNTDALGVELLYQDTADQTWVVSTATAGGWDVAQMTRALTGEDDLRELRFSIVHDGSATDTVHRYIEWKASAKVVRQLTPVLSAAANTSNGECITAVVPRGTVITLIVTHPNNVSVCLNSEDTTNRSLQFASRYHNLYINARLTIELLP